MIVVCTGDFLLPGISSRESVRSICTEASGTSIHGLTRRGLLYSNSTISAAVGLLVAVLLQQLFNKDPNCTFIPMGIVRVAPEVVIQQLYNLCCCWSLSCC